MSVWNYHELRSVDGTFFPDIQTSDRHVYQRSLCYPSSLPDAVLASFRADLPDFTFEFVQGTIPHTEGNGFPLPPFPE